MTSRRTRALVISALVALPLIQSTPVEAKRSHDTVRVTLHKLASSDGQYERTERPEWIADAGNRVALVADGESLQLESGTRMDVSASSLRGSRALSVSAVRKGRTVGVVRRAAVLANRRITVVPVQWASAPWKDADRVNVDGIISQLGPWWNAMSARQETLSFKVTSPVDATATIARGSCDIQAMADAAHAQLENSGLISSTDNTIVTFTADTKECSFAGLGEVGGTRAWAYAAAGFAGVWAHELGHNMGFPHANVCNAGVTLTYLAACTDVEYGNNADVMGSSVLSSFFSPTFLADAGFLPATSRIDWAGASTTYTIARADRTDLGVTAVRIPATDSSAGDNTFWLQYNPNRIGSVPQSATPTNGGIAVTMEPSKDFVDHLVTSDGVIGAANSTSYICDLTPPTSDLATRDTTTDPRLAAGRTWTDPRNRFKVTVVSADGTNAVVTVEPVGTPAVWVAATVTATPDPAGFTNLGVSWTPDLTNVGTNEPSRWSVDTAEDASKTCTVLVFATTCTLSNVSRSLTYTPRVTGTNGAALSAASVAGSTAVPVSPPTFTATFTATDTELTAQVTVNDGGGTVQGTPTIEIAGMPPCSLAVNATTACTFSGLGRRSTQVLVARGTNQAGTREKTFTAATLAGIPETPDVSGKMDKSNLLVTIAPSAIDESNVDYYYLQCSIGNKSWSKLIAADLEHSSFADITVPGVKGKATWCYTASIAMGATRQFTSDYGAVKVAANGKVTAGKLTLSAAAEAAKAGIIAVKWTTKDSLGKNITVNVNSSTKSCAKKSSISCLVSGVPSGARIVIRITARGQSGSRSIWKTVIVK